MVSDEMVSLKSHGSILVMHQTCIRTYDKPILLLD